MPNLVSNARKRIAMPNLVSSARKRIAMPNLVPTPSFGRAAMPSLAIAPDAVPTAKLLSSLRDMLQRHVPRGEVVQGTFLAHSLGTAYLAALIKNDPSLVAAGKHHLSRLPY